MSEIYTPKCPEALAAYSRALKSYSDSIRSLIRDNREDAEKQVREALREMRKAFLYDDRPPVLSRRMHSIGRAVQEVFGCPLELKDGGYRINCPVYLLHFVGGFSVGGTGTAICSVCGEPMLECDHVPGEIYRDVVARRSPGGLCMICGREKCEHEEGISYESATAFGIMTDIDLDHIALVSQPEDPLCTVYGVSVSKRQIERQLSSEELAKLVYGKTQLYCTHCLECAG